MSENSRVAPTAVLDMPAGSGIDLHRHDEHQLVYPSSGAVEIRTDAGAWIAPPDRALWIPAGCRHEHRFHGRTRFHCVGFAVGPVLPRPRVLGVSPLVRELIIVCSAADLPAAEVARLRRVLLDQLRRCPEQSLELPAATDDRLRRACAIVGTDLSVPRPLAELGRAAGASERTLARLFRAEFAMTYPQWRTRLRLHRAVQLLADGETVTATAHRCGWSSASAFVDIYRREFGVTPGAARRSAGC